MKRFLPILDWGRGYSGAVLIDDLTAATIVTIMLIPQSLAYALLAGLPPQAGLYASIAPLLAYTLFGTSRALAVGPVAVISLMTAAAVGRVAEAGTADYVTAAFTLAAMSGAILLLLGAFRLGALANFLSHPVISGFIIASAILISLSQIGALIGVRAGGHSFPDMATALIEAAPGFNVPTLTIGAASLAFLFWARTGLKPLLIRLRVNARLADVVTRAGPILAVAASIGAVAALDLADRGVAVVGDIPQGLPPLTTPILDPALWKALAAPALLLSIVGFVESVSVAQTLAAKRRQRIDPDQELIALGASNVAAGFTGGFPVTGGFARSVVNFDAGARTPAAGGFTAMGLLLAALFLTPLLHDLPKATLAATIIVAVLSLIDIKAPARVWRFSKTDFAAMALTIAGTLLFGVESGIAAGVLASLALHLKRTASPHSAIVGQAPGTEHFRNVERHEVVTSPHILTLRVDESLYFANARFLEDRVAALVAERPDVKHVILMCPAVNDIDASALESLEAINHRLKDAGVTLHLSEVKGPVMDKLHRSHFLDALTGRVFLTQFGAISLLDPARAKETLAMAPTPLFEEERNGALARS